ncbi:hypothetical protein B0H21DRAFT_745711 [Amylocystis lapponica]|nr:hypothetical protein B0H21DRAFT_745711 [Amylocystis lapponica]
MCEGHTVHARDHGCRHSGRKNIVHVRGPNFVIVIIDHMRNGTLGYFARSSTIQRADHTVPLSLSLSILSSPSISPLTVEHRQLRWKSEEIQKIPLDIACDAMDFDKLNALTYPQVQELAQRENVRANHKKANIIRLLLAKFPDGVPPEPEQKIDRAASGSQLQSREASLAPQAGPSNLAYAIPSPMPQSPRDSTSNEVSTHATYQAAKASTSRATQQPPPAGDIEVAAERLIGDVLTESAARDAAGIRGISREGAKKIFAELDELIENERSLERKQKEAETLLRQMHEPMEALADQIEFLQSTHTVIERHFLAGLKRNPTLLGEGEWVPPDDYVKALEQHQDEQRRTERRPQLRSPSPEQEQFPWDAWKTVVDLIKAEGRDVAHNALMDIIMALPQDTEEDKQMNNQLCEVVLAFGIPKHARVLQEDLRGREGRSEFRTPNPEPEEPYAETIETWRNDREEAGEDFRANVTASPNPKHGHDDMEVDDEPGPSSKRVRRV